MAEQKKRQGRTWPDWYPQLTDFKKSSKGRATWQLINTLVPYFALWYLMILLIQLGYSYAWTLILAVLGALFLVRSFILFHDCVHASLFPSKGANTFVGYLLGVLVFTPFEDWRFAHLRHHVSYANLNARGYGDIWTMTLAEYQAAPWKTRLLYRLYRNPLVMLGLGPIFLFLLRNRLPTKAVSRREYLSVLFTNLFIIAAIIVAVWLIGWRTYVLIQLPILWVAGAAGIWLFYVQHQFPGGYWANKDEWEPMRAAMEGTSFYKMPGLLRWFSSNISYHYIHHLGAKIPNYSLKKCYDAILPLQAKAPLPMSKSAACLRVKLWDEQRQEMVPFP